MKHFLLGFLVCGLVLEAAFAGPIMEDTEQLSYWEIEMELEKKAYDPTVSAVIGVNNQKPVQEIVHVHHVPVKIPVYASIVVHDNQHEHQHQHSQAGIGHNPFYQNGRESEAYSCAAPNGGGFRRLFKEAKALLPMQQIRTILKDAYKNDPEVRAFTKIVASKDTLDKIHAISRSAQYSALCDYACQKLYLDMKNFFRFAGCLINADKQAAISAHPIFVEPAQDFKGRPGVRGLLHDIYDVLPREELRQLYKSLKASDPYLAASVEGLKEPEFRQLFSNLRNTPEYKELRQIFIDAGLKMLHFNKLVATALGWEGEAPEIALNV